MFIILLSIIRNGYSERTIHSTVSAPETPVERAPHPPTEQLQGIVERVTFHADDSGYTIARLKVPAHADLVTLVGRFPSISAGQTLRVSGFWREHPKFGQQFQVLCPATRGEVGTRQLNSMLQQVLNPPSAGKAELARGGSSLRVGPTKAIGNFLAERFKRLFIPYLCGVFLLGPPAVYIERITHAQFTGSFWQFLPHYFDGWYGAERKTSLEQANFDGSQIGDRIFPKAPLLSARFLPKL
jgi:hypothetical protein